MKKDSPLPVSIISQLLAEDTTTCVRQRRLVARTITIISNRNLRMFRSTLAVYVCAILVNLINNQSQQNAIEALPMKDSQIGHRPEALRNSVADSLAGNATPINNQEEVSSHNSTDDNSTPKLVNNLDTNALVYLQKYGYMSRSNSAAANQLISEESFSSAISSFQRFAGIPETGIVDERTQLYMQMPRCGNSDKPNSAQLARRTAPANRRSTQAATGTGSQQPVRIRKQGAGNWLWRRKRYALQGSKWRRQELTYRISQYPTRFNGKRHEVDSQIERAFGIWSQVAPIDFIVKREGRVHIDIRFASGDHGDGDAFDGPGNTLAHAYFPQYGGDAHFDDQEYWTVDSYAGTNIFQVAAHELGHSLGLGHSNVREALMAPFYQKYKPNFKLHVDDVLAIQALYGEKPFLSQGDSLPPLPKPEKPAAGSASTGSSTTASSTVSSTTTTSTTVAPPPIFVGQRSGSGSRGGGRNKPGVGIETNDNDGAADGGLVPDFGPSSPSLPPGNGIGPPPSPGIGGEFEGAGDVPTSGGQPADLCSDSQIDAVTRTDDGSSYVFKGDYYWLLTNEGLARNYPRKISSDWDGLPGQLDAALTWADGKTFFFKGNKYWRYRNRRRDVGYPKLISAGFSGIPDDIDAAFVWSGNGRTYIFKGAEYWRFDSKADPPVSAEYPRSIKVWNGVPSHVNAAFRWENNVTYFFKGSQYYRFNDKEFKVESRGRPPFPRPSAEWWFGCVNSNLAQRALSSSLREEETGGRSGQVNVGGSQQQQDIDWSFFAGLDNQSGTRIMGTHISDHKPPITEGEIPGHSNSNNNNNDQPPNTRLGAHHFLTNNHHYLPNNHHYKTTISSSAISTTTRIVQCTYYNIIMTLVCILFTSYSLFANQNHYHIYSKHHKIHR